MKEEARRHLRRAKRLLSSVEARVEAELPEIIAHTAYYAMYMLRWRYLSRKAFPLRRRIAVS